MGLLLLETSSDNLLLETSSPDQLKLESSDAGGGGSGGWRNILGNNMIFGSAAFFILCLLTSSLVGCRHEKTGGKTPNVYGFPSEKSPTEAARNSERMADEASKKVASIGRDADALTTANVSEVKPRIQATVPLVQDDLNKDKEFDREAVKQFLEAQRQWADEKKVFIDELKKKDERIAKLLDTTELRKWCDKAAFWSWLAMIPFAVAGAVLFHFKMPWKTAFFFCGLCGLIGAGFSAISAYKPEIDFTVICLGGIVGLIGTSVSIWYLVQYLRTHKLIPTLVAKGRAEIITLARGVFLATDQILRDAPLEISKYMLDHWRDPKLGGHTVEQKAFIEGVRMGTLT